MRVQRATSGRLMGYLARAYSVTAHDHDHHGHPKIMVTVIKVSGAGG